MVSTHAALIYTMVMVSAVDREMTDSELSAIGEIVKHLPVFRGYDPNLLPQTASACAEMLSSDDGFQAAMDLIREAVPEELHETAYALAIEVAAADGSPSQEELRILEVIRHHLGIDRLIAAGIERGARARFATG